MKYIFILLLLSSIIYSKEKKLSVFVSIAPQKFFVENIGKNNVNVNVMVKPGENPESYSLTTSQMIKLSRADIYFRIGVPFENLFIKKIRSNLKKLRIVDTRKNINLRKMKSISNKKNKGNDPHIWMSPILVIKQCKTICDSLCSIDPINSLIYKKNYYTLKEKLILIDKKIKSSLYKFKGKTIFVFHPAFGYFADEYDLIQEPIEIEGKSPKGIYLLKLIKKAKKKAVRIIFVQPQFDTHVAKKIAYLIKGTVIPIDPLAENYIKNLENIANKIKKGLK